MMELTFSLFMLWRSMGPYGAFVHVDEVTNKHGTSQHNGIDLRGDATSYSIGDAFGAQGKSLVQRPRDPASDVLPLHRYMSLRGSPLLMRESFERRTLFTTLLRIGSKMKQMTLWEVVMSKDSRIELESSLRTSFKGWPPIKVYRMFSRFMTPSRRRIRSCRASR